MRGLIASAGGVYRLPRAIPRAIAIECIVTGQPLAAERAYELGMVNRLVPKGEALQAATKLAVAIAASAPIVLAIARSAYDLEDEISTRTIRRRAEALMKPKILQKVRRPLWKKDCLSGRSLKSRAESACATAIIQGSV